MQKNFYPLILVLLMICLILPLGGCKDEAPDTFYTYQFVDADGSILKEAKAKEGELPIVPDDPTKLADQEYQYIFKGWDKKVEKLTQDVVYTAVYEKVKNKYTYIFVDEDGTILKTDTIDYGLLPIPPSNPAKESDEDFDYLFSGWDKTITAIKEYVTYKATYIKTEKGMYYTYQFVDEDGTILKKSTVLKGTMPVPPSDPVKESDEDFDYIFKGWDQEIEPITKNVTYKATYTQISKSWASLQNKVISFLGDSITTFYDASSSVNSYYGGNNQFYYPLYSSTIKTVDKTWWYQLIKNTGMQLGINNSWSGSCAYGSGSSSGSHSGRVNTLDDKGTPDIVVIYLGTNDNVNGFTTEEFISAIKSIVSQIQANYSPQIYICTLGYSTYSGYSYTESRRVSYNSAIRSYASANNLGVIPLDEYITERNDSIYLGDKLHYNAKGATLLSLIAEKAICKYNGLAFNKTINVEYEEVLPAGVLGNVDVSKYSTSDFYSTYQNNIYLVPSNQATNPLYSLRIEIAKTNGKYYITSIIPDGTSQSFNSDYVLIISSAHDNYSAIKEKLDNVVVGSIVEFNPNISTTQTIVFKEGDGGASTGGGSSTGGNESSNKPMLNADGSLHISLYNTGIWQEYETKAAIYSYAEIQASQMGNGFTNFMAIKIDLITGNEYKVIELKPVGQTINFTDNDYYIFIFSGTKGQTFFNSLTEGNTLNITGDITSGNCDVALK